MDQFSVATIEEFEFFKQEKEKKLSYKKINTPFGYFGSKNKIALQFSKMIPPHYCWIEAFCGSAALTLAKPPAAIEVINDIDGEIVNVFMQLRNNQDELCRLISLTPYARQELESARQNNITDNELERARKFLVQAMMAINGVFGKGKGGFSYSNSYSRNGKDARVNRWYNLPERITKVVERLQNVRIENRDALGLLEMFINRPATLIYLDPPYLANRTEGYINDINDEAYHEKMLETADCAKCMIFISSYENDLYNSYLTKKKGWERKIINTATKDNNGKIHDRSEIIWMNKYFQQALKTGRVPIKLTEKEFKQRKLNPIR